MKKAIIMLFIGMILFIHPQSGYGSESSDPAIQVIPDEAIRLRILANSNSEEDQRLKRIIRDQVNAEITTWVEDLTSIEKARTLIENRIGQIEHTVGQVLKEQGADYSYGVEYGMVNFPAKLYGSYLYPPGEYEAILITIGAGKGDNWWCVLFPPLCFLDFSNGTTVTADETATDLDEGQKSGKQAKVKFFVVEWAEQLWDWILSVFA
ncbi:MAG: stage II sporulation protein R [Bacillaceae bacterium]|nr:stage II sporulation protein R [Bacillaceae bacterium]